MQGRETHGETSRDDDNNRALFQAELQHQNQTIHSALAKLDQNVHHFGVEMTQQLQQQQKRSTESWVSICRTFNFCPLQMIYDRDAAFMFNLRRKLIPYLFYTTFLCSGQDVRPTKFFQSKDLQI